MVNNSYLEVCDTGNQDGGTKKPLGHQRDAMSNSPPLPELSRPLSERYVYRPTTQTTYWIHQNSERLNPHHKIIKLQTVQGEMLDLTILESLQTPDCASTQESLYDIKIQTDSLPPQLITSGIHCQISKPTLEIPHGEERHTLN